MQFTSSESIVIRWKTKVAISIQLPYIPEKAEYSANSTVSCVSGGMSWLYGINDTKIRANHDCKIFYQDETFP